MWCLYAVGVVGYVIGIVEKPETGHIVHSLFSCAFDGLLTGCWVYATKNCARKIQDGSISA